MEESPVFIVGVSRSGTTLLMAMLSTHPSFALTQEWRFLPDLLTRDGAGNHRPALVTLRQLLAEPRVRQHGLDEAAISAKLRDRPHATAPDAVRVVMEAYAAARGKHRWGDKTPNNVLHLPVLADAFPDARFVHLIRDGREVADANRDAPWPPSSLRFWAGWWARGVRRARAEGARLPGRYLEVRYERLVAEPAATFETVLRFLGEVPTGKATAYVQQALAMGDDLPPIHRGLRRPPTPGLRDWRSKWSHREIVDVEALAGSVLDELGYERSVPPAGPARRAALTGWYYAVGVGKRVSASLEGLRLPRARHR